MRHSFVEKKFQLTYCIYLEINLFMTAPVIPMQGRIDDIAKASRHDLAKARIKPVKNADKKLTTNATFSEVPCCTKSIRGNVNDGTRSKKKLLRAYGCRSEYGSQLLRLQLCRNIEYLVVAPPEDNAREPSWHSSPRY